MIEYTIRCDVESVNQEKLSAEFKTKNCLHPQACCPKEQYRGRRLQYETDCNTVGWALAWLNPPLRGNRGLIQRAVDNWRNSNQDRRFWSHRVRCEMNGRSKAGLANSHPGQIPSSASAGVSPKATTTRHGRSLSGPANSTAVAEVMHTEFQLPSKEGPGVLVSTLPCDPGHGSQPRMAKSSSQPSHTPRAAERFCETLRQHLELTVGSTTRGASPFPTIGVGDTPEHRLRHCLGTNSTSVHDGDASDRRPVMQLPGMTPTWSEIRNQAPAHGPLGFSQDRARETEIGNNSHGGVSTPLSLPASTRLHPRSTPSNFSLPQQDYIPGQQPHKLVMPSPRLGSGIPSMTLKRPGQSLQGSTSASTSTRREWSESSLPRRDDVTERREIATTQMTGEIPAVQSRHHNGDTTDDLNTDWLARVKYANFCAPPVGKTDMPALALGHREDSTQPNQTQHRKTNMSVVSLLC